MRIAKERKGKREAEPQFHSCLEEETGLQPAEWEAESYLRQTKRMMKSCAPRHSPCQCGAASSTLCPGRLSALALPASPACPSTSPSSHQLSSHLSVREYAPDAAAAEARLCGGKGPRDPAVLVAEEERGACEQPRGGGGKWRGDRNSPEMARLTFFLP